MTIITNAVKHNHARVLKPAVTCGSRVPEIYPWGYIWSGVT